MARAVCTAYRTTESRAGWRFPGFVPGAPDLDAVVPKICDVDTISRNSDIRRMAELSSADARLAQDGEGLSIRIEPPDFASVEVGRPHTSSVIDRDPVWRRRYL